MNLNERDDALCRKRGWPTISQQKAYWLSKEADHMAIITTLQNITKAIEGLLAIAQDQQKQINNLRK